MPVEEKTEQREADEKVVEIELERLRSFTNHMAQGESGNHYG